MSIFSSLNTTSSALTAQRLRMDVISSNMANAETTRANFVDGKWQPYRRKMVEIEPNTTSTFTSVFNQVRGNNNTSGGVKVTNIVEDKTEFKLVYNPEHPDADDLGYIAMPNVDPLKETVDMMSATRNYEANITVFNANKSMLMKSLEIGK